jgi:predicted transposase YbfD/YdcC
VETIRMAHQHAPVTSDDRVSLASLGRSATTCVTMSRQHGDIEHTRQWSLDVTFNADRGRLRTDPAAENRVALRHVALHLVRQEPSRRIRLRQQRLFGSLDEHYLLTIIARVT